MASSPGAVERIGLLWSAAVGLLLPLSLLASGLAAAAPNPWLENAKSAYTQLDCERVLSELDLAAKVPTNDLATQLTILDYRGRCEVALGQRPEAEATFTKMLGLNPQAELEPGLSPKILDAFKAVKLRLYPADYLALRELPGSEALHRVELVDPWRKATQVVLGRWNPSSHRFDEAPLIATEGIYQVQTASTAPWFLEARSGTGAPLALLGRKESPVLAPVATTAPSTAAPLAVTTPVQPSSDRSALRWAAVGGGAALIVAAIALFAVAGTSRSSAVRAQWADDSEAIGRRSATEGAGATVLLLGGAAAITTGLIVTW